MSKQRLAILIASVVGLISIFLPWVSLGPFSVSGSSGDGALLFFLLIPILILPLIGERNKNLSGIKLYVTLILAVLALFINIYTFSNIPMGVGIGLYISSLSSIALVVLPLVIKEQISA